MKKLIGLHVLLTILFTLSLCAENATALESVLLYNGKVSFEIPTEFSQMSKERIEYKFPRADKPQYVYATKNGATSIAVKFQRENRLTEGQLPQFKADLESVLARIIPGLKWIEKGYKVINGKRWIRLELVSNAIDTEIHNIFFITSYEGSALMFNFNSTKEDYNKMKDKLTKSINSVKLK